MPYRHSVRTDLLQNPTGFINEKDIEKRKIIITLIQLKCDLCTNRSVLHNMFSNF